jgi:hypothetical protein
MTSTFNGSFAAFLRGGSAAPTFVPLIANSAGPASASRSGNGAFAQQVSIDR